ncbi:hypothetical protein BJ166DRAFT_606841 [Pestalotiopsis sp. NC0098]|nr:hypothetical protein BJ166DRAFT_606841 [Pestalotiopsis sp. NC0098]
MSKNNQSGANTSRRSGNSPGEAPSASNDYTDSRSDNQLIKDGGWNSKYHMMQSYGLSVYKNGDSRVVDQMIYGFRKIDMYQAREEASDHQGGATARRGYDGQDAYVGAQGRGGGSQDSRHLYSTPQYGGNNQYDMVAQGRDSGPQQVDDSDDDDDEDEDDDSEDGYDEDNVGHSGYFEGGGNDYDGDYADDDDGDDDYDDGDDDDDDDDDYY